MSLLETIKQAIINVRSNLLRSGLTILIIAFGIMSLIGILTAIDSIVFSLSDSFSGMGANTFVIAPKDAQIGERRGGRVAKIGSPITYRQAEDFKERFTFPATVGITLSYGQATVRYGSKKTNPSVEVSGVDEHAFSLQSLEIEKGRNFSDGEILNGSNAVILGTGVIEKISENDNTNFLDKYIEIDNEKYKVIGILKAKGSSINKSADNICIIPLLTAKKVYANDNSNYILTVGINDASRIEEATMEAKGLFRQIRQLSLAEQDDFETQSSEGLVEIIKDNTKKIRLATIAIGLITLLGAAIGLMNIMLVSVTERTKEIGICKALGATRNNIMNQFLSEAIIICQIGGLIGIVLGILIGNIVTLLIGGKFLIPWGWTLVGVITCFVVGVISGIYPASKASKLDPIESLRYE